MKIKVLAIVGLSAFLLFGACKGNSNTNSNTVVVATATPIVKTSESATVDPNMKGKIESALKGKGFANVTVDTATTPATLRGTYPKGKLDEVIAAAQESNGGKPVKNEMTEAK